LDLRNERDVVAGTYFIYMQVPHMLPKYTLERKRTGSSALSNSQVGVDR